MRGVILTLLLLNVLNCHSQSRTDSLIQNLKGELDSDRVLVMSHRGDWRGAPENSLQAIKNCIKLGVDIVEVDLCRTKDGELILMHDKTLNRTTTGKGAPEDFTLAELKELYLRNGAAVKTNHRIATLREALELAKSKVLVYIDKRVQDYLDDVIKVMEETGTVNQCLIPCSLPYDEYVAARPGIAEKLHLIPVLNLTGSKALNIIDTWIANKKPLFFSTKFELENSAVHYLLNRIIQSDGKFMINSLSSDLCAGRDDDRAVEQGEYDESWGWIINKGASVIQTDRARELIPYLKDKTKNSANIQVIKDNDSGHENNDSVFNIKRFRDYILIQGDAPFSYSLYDINGILVDYLSVSITDHRIATQGLSSGQYILRVAREGHEMTYKFLM